MCCVISEGFFPDRPPCLRTDVISSLTCQHGAACHLPANTGRSERKGLHSRHSRRRGRLMMKGAVQGQHHQALLGDLNTMAHGIARFSPDFCRDRMRLLSLGQSEGGWFQRTVLDVSDPRFLPTDDGVHGGALHARTHEQPQNQRLAALGLPPAVCTDALNPGAACLSANQEPAPCPCQQGDFNVVEWQRRRGRVAALLARRPKLQFAALSALSWM